MRTETRALTGEEDRPPTDEEMVQYLRLAMRLRADEKRDYVSVVATHTKLEDILDGLIDDPKRTLILRAAGYAQGDIELLVMTWLSEAIVALGVAEKVHGALTPVLDQARWDISQALERLVKDLIEIRKKQRGL